jgi:hypothetical protein
MMMKAQRRHASFDRFLALHARLAVVAAVSQIFEYSCTSEEEQKVERRLR